MDSILYLIIGLGQVVLGLFGIVAAYLYLRDLKIRIIEKKKMPNGYFAGPIIVTVCLSITYWFLPAAELRVEDWSEKTKFAIISGLDNGEIRLSECLRMPRKSQEFFDRLKPDSVGADGGRVFRVDEDGKITDSIVFGSLGVCQKVYVRHSKALDVLAETLKERRKPSAAD